MKRARLFTIVVLAGAALFALFGGEYSTMDWLDLRRQEREERAAIERLTFQVDSLKRYSKRVETDRGLLEQLARENFGMIAKGEFLYHIESDSLDGQ
jgi:cell division protein FtsB